MMHPLHVAKRESEHVHNRSRCIQASRLATSLAYLSLHSCPASVFCLNISWCYGLHLPSVVCVLLLSCRRCASLWVPCVPLS